MIILPRQARDQYRESTQKQTVFSQLAHPIVSSVICGFGTAEEACQCIEWLNHPIPSEVWAELKTKGLIGAEAPTPA